MAVHCVHPAIIAAFPVISDAFHVSRFADDIAWRTASIATGQGCLLACACHVGGLDRAALRAVGINIEEDEE